MIRMRIIDMWPCNPSLHLKAFHGGDVRYLVHLLRLRFLRFFVATCGAFRDEEAVAVGVPHKMRSFRLTSGLAYRAGQEFFMPAKEKRPPKNTKDAKKKDDSWPSRIGLGARVVPGQNKFADLELAGPEVDQQSVLDARRPQIAKYLSNVFIQERLARLDFNDEAFLDEQIGEVVPQDRSVFVADFQRVLSHDAQTEIAESVPQAVLIHLFQVSTPEKAMKGKARLADEVAKCIDFASHRPSKQLPRRRLG
jgi:hypothetical protein